ncbi:MAG: TetR/AcrR family transcriptional regulator [Candidatus Eremiobacteraeota bacterium]|nr:TetR/AcrR family transcriptional regulator [Candidatus Eremiobacteraeota bacterium]
MELFWERGYSEAGIADVVGRAGVRSGSLYHFFESKEHLLVAVLEAYQNALIPHIFEPPFRRENDPLERVFAVLADYRERLLTTDFRYRCPIGSLALEVGPVSERARVLIDANFAAWRAAIASALRELARDAHVDADSLATFVLTVMEGGVMQAAAQRSAAPFDASVAHLRAYLTSLLQPKRSSP